MALHRKSTLPSAHLVILPTITEKIAHKETSAQQQISHARRSLWIFLGLVIIFTAMADIFTFLTQNLLCTLLMMWSPGVAALLTRLLLREGFSDITFRLGGKRTLVTTGIVIGTPATVGLIAYGVAWLSGLTPLVPFHASRNLVTGLTILGKQPTVIEVGLMIVMLGIEVFAATGEEIGWRGYMLTRLIDAKVPQPVFVSGLIWSLWHWPLFLFAAPIPSLPSQIIRASIFLITITSLGGISARLRLETGSIWPSIFLHVAWNIIILEIFDAFTKGTDTSLWTGEAGIFVALTMLGVAFLLTRGRWKQLRAPL